MVEPLNGCLDIMPISWLATSPSSTHCFGCCTKLPDQLEEDSDSDFGSLHDDPDLEKEEIRIDRAPSPGMYYSDDR